MYETDLESTPATAVLPADDVPVSVGRHPHRPLVHRHADRRDRPLPADARRERLPADRLRCVRPAGRERRDQERLQPARMDDARTSTTCAASSGRWARRSTGRRRSSPATPTTTAGTSGSSCGSSRPGLAYRAKSPVDWCPNDGTLAREQVEGADRHCWRCGAKVEKRDLDQWYLRVTKYADELLDFSGLDLPEPIQTHADELDRAVRGRRDRLRHRAVRPPSPGGAELRVFTTRPDTLFGATFMVLAPEHPLVATLTAPDRRAEVEAYVAQAAVRTEIDRLSTDREKTGVAIGADAINPVNGERIPIFVADYVLGWLRDGRDHGRPGPRRARLRVRRQVRPADPARRRRHPATRTREHDGAYIAARRRRGPGQQRAVQRAAGRRGRQGDPRRPGARGKGSGGGHVPPARLADQPPALLGHADPGHLLRAIRHRAGARGGPARPAAGHRRLRAAAARTRSPATRRS